MSAAENKAVFRRFYEEVVNKQNADAIYELTAADIIEHQPPPPPMPQDREGVKQFFQMMYQSFPDLKVRIDDEVAEDDRVVARTTWTGTHKGEFLGIPATGKQVSFSSIDIGRFKDGKITEHWGETDYMSVLQQLGVIPTQQA